MSQKAFQRGLKPLRSTKRLTKSVCGFYFKEKSCLPLRRFTENTSDLPKQGWF